MLKVGLVCSKYSKEINFTKFSDNQLNFRSDSQHYPSPLPLRDNDKIPRVWWPWMAKTFQTFDLKL